MDERNELRALIMLEKRKQMKMRAEREKELNTLFTLVRSRDFKEFWKGRDKHGRFI